MDTFLNKHDLLGAPTGLCILAGVGRSDERRMDVERLNPYAWTPFQARMPKFCGTLRKLGTPEVVPHAHPLSCDLTTLKVDVPLLEPTGIPESRKDHE
ncbi:hypothetical protein HZH66_003088 [Vespula vulgaris]|uniref:Uncharacterized protein n=1 Tax=Vespula vulgaris TaxID=7454 RepID=A0A834KMM3_VESVU|nr:hypothetical protein HZH66_003088 [Vespula vulgaris]